MVKYLKAVRKAWRPFSLTAAFIPTSLGSVAALMEGEFRVSIFILVTLGGILIQSGVNLINDFFEFKSGILPEKFADLELTFKNRLKFEYLIFGLGMACFLFTIPLGLYLAYQSGMQLLAIGIIGFIGGYSYTGKPFSYKDKSLGVILVFFLMGVLMVYGSYFAFTARFSYKVILISLPISFPVSLLLLSNEIRDIESDTLVDLKTLSVTIGYLNARRLYLTLLLCPYLLVIILTVAAILPFWALLVFISLPYGLKTYRMLSLPHPQRRVIVPRTASVHFQFGCLLITSLLIQYFLQ